MRIEGLAVVVAIATMTMACGQKDPIGAVGGEAGTGAGTAGTTGAAGTTGIAGTTGVAGTTGIAGTTGVAGTTGIAGTNGAAGSPADVNAVWPGAGCGKLPAFQAETVPGTPKGYTHYTVMGTGATLAGTNPLKAGPRSFWVRVPADYDWNRPYRVVYIGQGCGGYQIANTNTYPLYNEKLGGTEQAIYVALDIPENNVNMDCYDNRDGKGSQEWEAFELFHKVVDQNYCVDNNRVFVAGYSTGAWLANMWGCYFAGDGRAPAEAPATPRRFAPGYHIRGQFASAGGEPVEQPACGGPVAALFLHDQYDNGNVLAGAISALNRVGKLNGCDTNYGDLTLQAPWHPEEQLLAQQCKQFTKCPADYPVIFCTTQGLGHSDQRERATIAFTHFANELPPAR